MSAHNGSVNNEKEELDSGDAVVRDATIDPEDNGEVFQSHTGEANFRTFHWYVSAEWRLAVNVVGFRPPSFCSSCASLPVSWAFHSRWCSLAGFPASSCLSDGASCILGTRISCTNFDPGTPVYTPLSTPCSSWAVTDGGRSSEKSPAAFSCCAGLLLFVATASFVWTAIFFLVPETKHRSFTELDELFERKIPAWRFASTETEEDRNRTAQAQDPGNVVGADILTA
ncbi:hypothetical protein IAT40_007378 [Kwoniella sp. CBS 6097]